MTLDLHFDRMARTRRPHSSLLFGIGCAGEASIDEQFSPGQRGPACFDYFRPGCPVAENLDDKPEGHG